jgi:four helix bundle protein
LRNFRNLAIWQKSHQLVLALYAVTARFPEGEYFALVARMRQAAMCVPTKIAEGCCKESDSEFAKLLNVALGSLCEVEYELILSRDLRYLADADYQALDSQITELKRMLSGFISQLR